MHDVIIRGGRIADGSGGPARNGDIAIKDGLIVELGRVDGPARRVIDADGALVTPGFVDIHTHYDGQFLWDDTLDPSFSNGVTTVIAGNCGVGFAPARESDREMLMQLMEGVEDIPGAVLNEGLDWRWTSFPDYLNRLDGRNYAMDIGLQLTHAPLRIFVMGERAARHERASPEDIEQMARLVAEAMDAGAMGFSAARFLGHRSSTGGYVPGTFSDDDEMLALAAAMGASGKGVFQIVPHGAAGDVMAKAATREERIAEHERFVRLAQASGRPLTYMLIQFQSDPDDWKLMLEATDRANAGDVRLYPQTSARAAGALTTLDGYHPFMLRPSYLQIADLPPGERAAIMRQPDRRAAILSEADSSAGDEGQAMLIASYKDIPNIYLMSPPLDYEPTADRSLRACADRSGKSIEEELYDHLAAGDGTNFGATFATNYHGGSMQVIHDLLSRPNVVSGLGDAGAHVKFVCDGSLPSFQLAFWSRDRLRGPRLPLEFMVRKASKDCADLYGLSDRGQIALGRRADINVIDFDKLAVEPPCMTYDLPSGGGRLLQKSKGYLATLVAGRVTRENDGDTGARPGRLLRS